MTVTRDDPAPSPIAVRAVRSLSPLFGRASTMENILINRTTCQGFACGRFGSGRK